MDAFAGPGGWDKALRDLGIDPLGIEWDEAACATRAAAGLRTVRADVAKLDPSTFAPCTGFIGSPPCPTFSAAGGRAGHLLVELILRTAGELNRGIDNRDKAREEAFALLAPVAWETEQAKAKKQKRKPSREVADQRARRDGDMSLLVVEPIRWAHALNPTWIALEQVPDVLAIWKAFADLLRQRGYNVWAGTLSAERYGVPQTRRRAILMAHKDRPVVPPAPTHQAYVPGEPAAEQHTLEGTLLPWVSMAQALGWEEGSAAYRLARGEGMLERHGERRDVPDVEPAPVVTSKARTASWTLRTGMNSMKSSRKPEDMVPYERPVTDPAPTVDCKAGRAWKVAPEGEHTDAPQRWKDGAPSHYDPRQSGARPRPTDEPAPTMLSEGLAKGVPVWVNGNQENAARRAATEPAPTVHFGHALNQVEWTFDRPSTSVCGDPRISPPGWRGNPEDYKNPEGPTRSGDNAVRVTLEEAATLQDFPAGYPFQGSRTKQFEQCGNAIPPGLARAILSELVDEAEARSAA